MDNKISTYSPAFSIVSWIALVGGIVTYLLGLWNAEMQLNEKGYYEPPRVSWRVFYL
ncbi:hypothetical protein CL8FH52_42730 [Escherichia coli]|nr:hypothetical protein CL8FH52_42730 [Escherichia coli]